MTDDSTRSTHLSTVPDGTPIGELLAQAMSRDARHDHAERRDGTTGPRTSLKAYFPRFLPGGALDELPMSDFADFLAERPTRRRGISLDPRVNTRAANAAACSAVDYGAMELAQKVTREVLADTGEDPETLSRRGRSNVPFRYPDTEEG
jgi:hypothetical protein